MKKKKSDWFIVMENENSGLVASMTGLVERKRTELNRELSSYFRKRMPYYKGTYDEEESEEVLDGINSYLDDKKVDLSKLDFPYSSGSEIYLIPIGENIRLKVIVTDEYYGGGDYDKGKIGRASCRERMKVAGEAT